MNAVTIPDLALSRRDAMKLFVAGSLAVAGGARLRRSGMAQETVPVAANGVDIVTFASFAIPAIEFPEPKYNVMFLRIVSPPTSRTTWRMNNKEILMGAVLEGALLLPVTERTWIRRSGGILGTPAIGEDVTLSPGDSFLEFEFTGPMTYANAADDPATWLSVEFDRAPGSDDIELETIGDPLEFTNGTGEGSLPVLQLRGDDAATGDVLIGTSLQIETRQLTFAPGGKLDLVDVYPVVRFVDQGQITWSFTRSDRKTTVPVVISSSIPWVEGKPDEWVTLENKRDDPVVIYELSLTPKTEDAIA